jgi:hypothetical protein
MALTLSTDSSVLRDQTREAARQHKASWIRLGQMLFTIHKEKYFKDWGFLSFEAYCMKELGIKQTTASKLLKSYCFLEKEEPRLASTQYIEKDAEPKMVPNYESVNLLRLAKENSKLNPQDFSDLRRSVMDQGKEPKDVRAQFNRMVELNREENTDEKELKESRRQSSIKRLMTTLLHSKKEFEKEHFVPEYLLKQINDLVSKLEDQLDR